MERLGLWGDGTAFKSFEAFLTSITKRGLGKVYECHECNNLALIL